MTGLFNRVIYGTWTRSDALSYLVVESCNFNHISSSAEDGTVILFSHRGIVLNKVCTNECQMNSNNQGIILSSYISESEKNFVIESSIVKCLSTQFGGAPLWLYHGDMKLLKTNISDSNVEKNACGYMGASYQNAQIAYTSYANNTSSKNFGCMSHVGTYTFKYHHCDVLLNKCSYYGVLYFETNGRFDSCNFVDNIERANHLFYIQKGSLNIESCYMNNLNASKNYPERIIDSSKNIIIQPMKVVGCETIIRNKLLKEMATCKRTQYTDRSVYPVIALFTEYKTK